MTIFGAIALNRFGLGAKADEMANVSRDPRGWLGQQIIRQPVLPPEMNGLPASGDMVMALRQARMEKKQEQAIGIADKDSKSAASMAQREAIIRELTTKLQVGITTQIPFYERLVSFWANHFTVSGLKANVMVMAGAYEREAIRPHIFGSFAQMVRAADLHPAMLFYLDNQLSVGPNSLALQRLAQFNERHPGEERKGGSSGLNENLAREIMELHTLGVDGGYSQTDVTHFANVLTGWTVPKDNSSAALFTPNRHEPGAQTILGHRFAEEGEAQAYAVLDMLATHEATARHIATKLARHFIADNPPRSAIEKLARVFYQTHGDLGEVTRALINLDEPWQQPLTKFKRPDEYVISIGRAMNDIALADKHIINAVKLMGMEIFRAPSPQGWPDTAADWAGADAVWKRIEFANQYAQRAGQIVDARVLVEAILSDTASARTRAAIQGAESPVQALGLLFCSPEFMRR